MEPTLLQETVQIQQELIKLQKNLGTLQVKVDRLVSQLQNKPTSIVDLEGIWSGLNLSFEVIQAAEFQLIEDLP